MINNKILIIEDEEITILALELFLTSIGYEITSSVNNAKDAIKSVKNIMPDLIISDIMIKGNISGCEVSALLNKEYNIPIIFLSAYFDDEILEYAKDANAYGYILKPYRELELKAMVNLALNHQNRNNINTNFINFDKYTFDLLANKVYKESNEIKIGKKALILLKILIKSPNEIVSIQSLISHIWMDSDIHNVYNLRQLVHRTKDKLELDNLISVKNMGYVFKV